MSPEHKGGQDHLAGAGSQPGSTALKAVCLQLCPQQLPQQLPLPSALGPLAVAIAGRLLSCSWAVWKAVAAVEATHPAAEAPGCSSIKNLVSMIDAQHKGMIQETNPTSRSHTVTLHEDLI